MFDRIKELISMKDEMQQLRRELAVVRSQRDLLLHENAELRHAEPETEADMYRKTIDELKEQVVQREKDVISAMEMFKREEHENKLLREQLAPKPCNGCIHSANYRKCASCARYPKLKDKYEGGEDNG